MRKYGISNGCIRGLMPNLIKKSWTVSNGNSIQEHEFMIALQGLITPPQLVLVITQCPFSVPGKEMQWLLRPEK